MIRIPIYFDMQGMHQIAIYEESEDGGFRRTSDEPMRLLRDNIDGIGPVVGELVTQQADREQRIWHSPTILYKRRAYSFYHFQREQLKHRKVFVFKRVSRNTHITRMDMHELQLKHTASLQVRALLSKKMTLAIDVDPEHIEAVDIAQHTSTA